MNISKYFNPKYLVWDLFIKKGVIEYIGKFNGHKTWSGVLTSFLGLVAEAGAQGQLTNYQHYITELSDVFGKMSGNDVPWSSGDIIITYGAIKTVIGMVHKLYKWLAAKNWGKMGLITIIFLTMLLVASCNASYDGGSYNQDNDNYNIKIDYNKDGKVDSKEQKKYCTLCFSDPSETDSCNCAYEADCQEEDISDAYISDFYACSEEEPIALGEELTGDFEVDSGIGEGAL